MNKMMLHAVCVICAVAVLAAVSCTREKVKPNNNSNINNGGQDVPLSELDIDKKFLAEGFITGDLYRVVIVSPQEAATDMDALKTRAMNRARVSLERSLSAESIESDRTVKTAILNLIERSGALVKKDIENSRYAVYYFDITRKNIKGYFKNISSQR
jgi:hypothetical protein